MGAGYGVDAIQFLIETIVFLYVLVVVLRFLMQAVRADYYNPLAQAVVKLTNPPLIPLRRVVPGVAGHDMAALVLAILLLYIKLLLFKFIGLNLVGIGGAGALLQSISIFGLFLLAIFDLVALFINVFTFAIFVQVIISWISPGTYNPAAALLQAITQPVMKPIRRLVPPISGLDLSPMVALIGLQLIKMLLMRPLVQFAHLF